MDWDATSYTDAPHCIRRFDPGLTLATARTRCTSTVRSGARRCGRSGRTTSGSGITTADWDTTYILSQFDYAPDTSFRTPPRRRIRRRWTATDKPRLTW